MIMMWTRDPILPKWRSDAGIVFRPCDKRTFRLLPSNSDDECHTRFRSADAAMREGERLYLSARRSAEEAQAMFAGCI